MQATPAAGIPVLSAAMWQPMPAATARLNTVLRVIRYMPLRWLSPTGKIVQLGARLQKQTTGYCLEQLIIGSEGTLGIITQITVKLLPLPKYSMDLLAVFESPEDAIAR